MKFLAVRKFLELLVKFLTVRKLLPKFSGTSSEVSEGSGRTGEIQDGSGKPQDGIAVYYKMFTGIHKMVS